MLESSTTWSRSREHDGRADSFGWTQHITNSGPREILGNCRHLSRSSAGAKVDQANVPLYTQHIHADSSSWQFCYRNSAPRRGPPQSSRRKETKTQSNSPYRWPLHRLQFAANGRLPSEAPLAFIEKMMDDHATQPSTIPYVDPRRVGKHSMLSEQDEADILCILIPASGPALQAVDLVEATAPQHILQNYHLEGIEEVDELEYDNSSGQDENLMKSKTEEASDNEAHRMAPLAQPAQATHTTHATQTTQPTQPAAIGVNGKSSRDIALRMSSKVHNPSMGFVFGRNAKRSDLLLSKEEKLSNNHFRIFLNRHGVLMLEDMSTNGTIVDNVVLTCAKAQHKHEESRSTRTLNNGAIIALPTMKKKCEETIRFIVRFPSRERAQEEYNQRLVAYLGYIQQTERQLQVAAHKKGELPPPALLPFNPKRDQAEASPNASMLAAATGGDNHGLGWNGGDKYNIIKPIGKGAFAVVYQLSAKKDGEVYACKQIEKRRFMKDGILNHKVHNEIHVMEDLEHPNIVKYIEFHETKAQIFIIMEFVHFGDLSTYTETGTAMPEYMCQMMAHQMLNALQYLHVRKITHRDIKPDNILVSSHNPFTFKLSDFGLSKIANNEQTLLKSFCGTLLYCAPEIYPGFQRARMGLHPSKRTRSGEPYIRKGTLPYEDSVDTWSIAAVLFHLLCGHAPYTGSMDDEGATMLMNIMRTTPNWEYLEQAGISLPGRDFVMRSLVIDPHERAREADLLEHPWLTGEELSSSDLFQVTAGDDADGLDASQLSIADRDQSEGEEKTQVHDDDVGDLRASKRSKYFQEPLPEEPIDLFGGPNRLDWYGMSAYQWNDSQATSNQGDQHVQRAPANERLFGEIGSSALRSSGLFGDNAHAALGMEAQGSYVPGADESFMDPELEGVEGVSFIPPNANSETLSNPPHASPDTGLQYPQLLPSGPYAGAAPSLEGAEALVDQMNMDSPTSSISGPSADSKPTTPKTPRSYDASNIHGNANQSTGSTKAPSSQVTPKPAVNARSQRHNYEHNPKNRAQGSQSSAHEQSEFGGLLHNTNADDEFRDSQQRPSAELQNYSDAQRLYPSLPSTGSNSQGSAQDATAQTDPDSQKLAPAGEQLTVQSSHQILGLPPPSSSSAEFTVSNKESEDIFKTPLPRYGVLTPVSGSIKSETIRLEHQYTSFGRHPKATVRYSDQFDDRIPKMALEILLWYPNIEKDIARGRKDWHENPRLTAILSTQTRRYVKVNGVILTKDTDQRRKFGKLYDGDIVEIFGPPRNDQYLRFRCEFFVGRSQYQRKANNPFEEETSEKTPEKGSEQGPRASKEPSVTSSRAGSVTSMGPKASSGEGEGAKSTKTAP